MHELGLVIDAVEMTERYAGENNIEQIKALVLRIGEGFSAVPSLIPTLTTLQSCPRQRQWSAEWRFPNR